MRNAFAFVAIYRHRRALHLSRSINHLQHNSATTETVLHKCLLLAHPKHMEVITRPDVGWLPSCLLHQNFYSTSFSSVHGEKPSAEYAKLRKESLESQFGLALGTYSSKSFSTIYRFGPFLALYRAAVISFHVFKLTFWQLFVQDIQKRAIKVGQALSTRPDILPTVYCQELAKLQDQIPPFPTDVAIRSIETQLGIPISEIFSDISPEPIAAASLGQVYKAHLHSGETVAVKVQRPGMSLSLTLDALLFHMIGGQLKRFAKARRDLLVAVTEVVRHMFDEIDYVLEGKNAERFASLFCLHATGGSEQGHKAGDLNKSKPRGAKHIKVPKIYWDYTRTTVLTMEWIDGIKLTDETRLNKASLNKRELIDQGLYCSLMQLLEVGYFHADPHPGNLVAIHDGSLAYFDFGMMGDIPRHYRIGLIQMLVHFVNRDSLGLANDFLSLGFIPEGVDVHSVSDALKASFSDRTSQSQDFQGIMNQLYEVMYEFNFSLPPDYALVIRALGSLEGTAKVLDPDFKVIESAYPFVIGRLIEDPSPDMRRILRQLLIRNNGSIRWNRLERLIAAISGQASESTGDPSSEKPSSPLDWKVFDMHAVVDATEDLLLFILSDKGSRVRLFLLWDIIEAADIFLQDEVIDCLLNEKLQDQRILLFEERTILNRIGKGFQYFCDVIKLAPVEWTAMLLRMSVKPEVHKFTIDIISALVLHFNHKLREASWLYLSKLLHKLRLRLVEVKHSLQSLSSLHSPSVASLTALRHIGGEFGGGKFESLVEAAERKERREIYWWEDRSELGGICKNPLVEVEAEEAAMDDV
ncbi:sll0005 isoform A [Senna tora]|uniref:Sll0005 isoform A n=1 Tax=Senna tora TaxID=362788 RepID=A0A834TH60_9FABA|nr:sll0005 isoform A [Senna tora]